MGRRGCAGFSSTESVQGSDPDRGRVREVQRRTGEVGVHRCEGAAEDGSLAAAVVEEMRGVDGTFAVDLEGCAGTEASGVKDVTPQVQKIDHRLLQPIWDGGKIGEVAQRR